MHSSYCRPRIGLEALESRLTPSDTPLSATLPLLPALTVPALPSGPLTDLHLPAPSLSATLSLGDSRGLGLGLQVGSLSLQVNSSLGLSPAGLGLSLGADASPLGGVHMGVGGPAGLLSLNLKSDLPVHPAVNETIPVGAQVPQLLQIPQLPQLPSLPIAGTLATLPTSIASLPALPQTPALPARVVDPTLFAVSQQTANVPSSDDSADSGSSAAANLLASRASNLAWANMLGGDAEFHEFTGFLAAGRNTGFTTTTSGDGAVISEDGFNLRDGQLVEDFDLDDRMDAPIVPSDDSAPAESTSDSALTLWLLGVLATCAGGSAYLSWRRQQNDLSLDVDPRLMPVG